MENKPIAKYYSHGDGKLLECSFTEGELLWARPLDYVYKCEVGMDHYLRIWNLDDQLLHEACIENTQEDFSVYIEKIEDYIIETIDEMFGKSKYE